ncbi:MAG: hypothetical protein CVV02_10050 [Firmicutes bacterium HGW-Firmicutes-7]|nr:MAG: hypothetical protein CVV02_10050 [Firmicutes bacterium HGW-Firmicutes-7]
MAQIQTSIGIADVTLAARSKETGIPNTPFIFNADTTTSTNTTIWESIDGIGQLFGSVVIFGTVVPSTTNILINGANTTAIFENQTFARSVDPLNSISVIINTSATNTELSVAISASKFEF